MCTIQYTVVLVVEIWVILGSRVSTLNFICTKKLDTSLINKKASDAIFVIFLVPSGVG